MKEIHRIDVASLFGTELCSVQNPSSYIGGEIGSVRKDGDLFGFAIAFPDVYSIGMSNQAVKIIYNALNALPSVRCERVFAVEGDFESLLRRRGVPLCTLESGIPLREMDMVGFSVGYELGITGMISVLDLGGIPVLAEERGGDDPIVIAGGCGVTNPAPFARFIDAAFIGEAEGGMFDLVGRLAEMRRAGATRAELLSELSRDRHVWTAGMTAESCGHSRAFRAVWPEFGRAPSVPSFLPLPAVKPVQDHGVVEIMRGCPNGCRFCHAGVYYRPQRVKEASLIFSEVERLVGEGGYREISLTSLSSADYPGIEGLLDGLNERYRSRNVSFQLPSLKVNSFSLPLLEKLSEVRKSALTFAVETPDEARQLRLNKEVYAQHLVDIILDAKARGWSRAKFYFMVGLPFPDDGLPPEEESIAEFMLDLQRRTRIQCAVNVGVFVPKPHTAYQWAAQISPAEAERKLSYIKSRLPRGKFSVGAHNVFSGLVEGLFSRGDSRAGAVALAAYRKGARLDAWENHLRENRPLWEEAFAEAGFDVGGEILRERAKDEPLPWDSVSLGPTKAFFLSEWERHESAVLTPRCSPECGRKCGVCSDSVSARTDARPSVVPPPPPPAPPRPSDNIPVMHRAVFSFSKSRGGEFLSHLALVELFNRAILRSGLPVIFSTGFNPIPRLEFAGTLSLGIRSDEEIASLVLFDPVPEDEFTDALNRNLADGIQIGRSFIFPVTNQRRRESLSSALWGAEYDYDFLLSPDEAMGFFVSEAAEKFLADGLNSFGLDELCGKGRAAVRLAFRSDRPFRDALSEAFRRPLHEIAAVTKRRTLAKPEVTGWTAEMNGAYRKSLLEMESRGEMPAINARFKALAPRESPQTAAFTDYFELYARIAAANAALIEQRERR